MSETIGQRLKQNRLSRKLSLENVAEATRVRVIYLQALENNDYSAMSSAAQGRGFLRLYADFLGLDLDAAMADMREAETPPAPTEVSAPPVTVSAPPAPQPAPQTPPVSTADGKPGRRGFWSRLIRRSAPEPEAAALSELPATAAESSPVSVPESEPEIEAPQPVRATRTKKPAAEKPKSSAKSTKSKTVPKAKEAEKVSGKKKGSMKSRSNH